MHLVPPLGAPGEEGTTLVELLVAVAILGIAFVAILGGMMTSVTASDVHRKQADGLALLTRNAEAVKAAPYVPCAPPAAYQAALTMPTDYVVSVTAVAIPAGSGFVSCTAAAEDTGIQRVSLKAEATSGTTSSETIEIIKRQS